MFSFSQKNGILVSVLAVFLLAGCARIPLETKNPGYISLKKDFPNQLTNRDIFDDELEQEITEDDIQQAVETASEGFSLPLSSRIILVQSGEVVPDIDMQNKMRKYYQISIYSGLPKAKSPPVVAKNKDKDDTPPVVQNNYMRTLRLVAAKGQQRTVVVYWGILQMGVIDEKSRRLVWMPYQSGKIPDRTTSMRYLLRFTLVDVATGNWSMYSPSTTEVSYERQPNPNMENVVGDIAQIEALKQAAYESAARELSEYYEKLWKAQNKL